MGTTGSWECIAVYDIMRSHTSLVSCPSNVVLQEIKRNALAGQAYRCYLSRLWIINSTWSMQMQRLDGHVWDQQIYCSMHFFLYLCVRSYFFIHVFYINSDNHDDDEYEDDDDGCRRGPGKDGSDGKKWTHSFDLLKLIFYAHACTSIFIVSVFYDTIVLIRSAK